MHLNLGELYTHDPVLRDRHAAYVFPVGAVEQHGPHLPVGTDTLILDAIRLSVQQRRRTNATWMWLPTLAYGVSVEHLGYGGTLALTPRTMMNIIDDVAASIAQSGGNTLVFVNGHGGNISILQVMLREVRRVHGLRTFLLRPFSSVAGRAEGLDIHAGWLETSLLLHLYPGLVDLRVERSGEGSHHAADGDKAFCVPSGWITQDLSENGAIGNWFGATSQDGQHLFSDMVAYVELGLSEIAERALEKGVE